MYSLKLTLLVLLPHISCNSYLHIYVWDQLPVRDHCLPLSWRSSRGAPWPCAGRWMGRPCPWSKSWSNWLAVSLSLSLRTADSAHAIWRIFVCVIIPGPVNWDRPLRGQVDIRCPACCLPHEVRHHGASIHPGLITQSWSFLVSNVLSFHGIFE